jgi:hypothetical protein
VKIRTAVLARLLPVLGTLFAFTAVSRADEPVFPADDQSVEKRLADADHYLSSDELEGRGLKTRGIELAAEFIARQFHEAGLKTDACGGTPFQKFPVTVDARLGSENRLLLSGPRQVGDRPEPPLALTLGRDYTPLASGDSCRFDLPLAFVGYGVTDPAAGYDDYAGVNAAGKAVIVLRQHPRSLGKDGKEHGCGGSGHSLIRRKIANAFEHGASAVIFLTDRVQLEAQAGDDKLMRLVTGGCRNTHRDLPVFHCRREAIEPAIRAAFGTGLDGLERQINCGGTGFQPVSGQHRQDACATCGPAPRSGDLTGWRVSGQTEIHRTQTIAKNVIGVLPGANPAASETVVVGAHYDHFGFIDVESHGVKHREFYSGADDNASGVSSLLEIARTLAHRGHPLPRQVVFLSFCAEEEGLLGSSFYVSHPVVPLSRTVVMVNLDMVGRLRSNTLYVRGIGTSVGWGNIIQRLNSRQGLSLVLQEAFGSSDQLSFYAKDVPILAFFTGRHEDYHETTDKFSKLNIPGMRRVARLASDVVESLADAPVRPQEVAMAPPDDTEPYFGAYGDFTRSDPGYALGPVQKGSPADRAGLKDGDLVVQIGANRIASDEDFDEALSHYLGGEHLKLVVIRGRQSRTCDITLGKPHPGSKRVEHE